MKKLGIYIHIPFCISKCKYCGFYSHGGSSRKEQEAYVDMLIEDIREYAITYGKERCETGIGAEESYLVDSIFIGGGTPTILSGESIEKILTQVRSGFRVQDDVEVTVESNPGTLSADKLSRLRRAGVNRLSMGVQSFDDGMLRNLGRVHTVADAVDSFKLARQQGFDNINIDLMFAIPRATMKLWEETLEQATALCPEHISFYSLQIEEGTPFYDMLRRGEIEQIPDEVDRQMYHKAIETFRAAGYEHYEISNCARAGYECRHNLKYWSMKDYLGIGSNASSFMEGVRFSEEPGLDYHINSKFDNMSEFVFTGLRKIEGISLKEFKDRFGQNIWEAFDRHDDEMEDFFNRDYIREEEGRLYLTEKGIDVSNGIMALFV